ncbi:MAG: lysophospholipid acyltransferase family protein [Rubricoccaceae bacterium]|nr:lysophospholipid acyltransferase family protein [Rubricoccaceae bacterium]
MPERISFQPPAPVHRPGPVAVLVGVVRILLVLAVAAAGALAVPLAALVPGRVRGVRPGLWVVVALARLFVGLFGIRLRGSAPDALRRHEGLVFINHLSYLDPVVVEAVTPVRFLATAGVRRLPFIGWIARSVGTVFVDRKDEESRAASREALIGALSERPCPPIVIAPEGQIGPGDRVLPFRHGALAVAQDAGVAVLPVVLQFDPFDAAVWLPDEWILRALWRLAARTTPFTATVTPLPLVTLGPEDDPAAVASALQSRFDAALGASNP